MREKRESKSVCAWPKRRVSGLVVLSGIGRTVCSGTVYSGGKDRQTNNLDMETEPQPGPGVLDERVRKQC